MINELYDPLVEAFDVLGDPVRRRLLELIGDQGDERTAGTPAGELTDAVRAEFGITQPAVSRHLRVLRESGFVSVRPQGQRRLYALEPVPFAELDAWLQRYRRFWRQRLNALDTEVQRGRRGSTTTSDEGYQTGSGEG